MNVVILLILGTGIAWTAQSVWIVVASAVVLAAVKAFEIAWPNNAAVLVYYLVVGSLAYWLTRGIRTLFSGEQSSSAATDRE